MKKALLTIGLVVLTMLSTLAENRLWMEDFSIEPGETKRVSLMLDNDKVFTAFQVDLVLPEGISIVTKSNGKPNVTINTDRADDHQMVTNIRENGNVSILMMSLESTPIMGNSGEIVSMQFRASDTFSGTHQIELVDAELTEVDGTATHPADTYCTVTGPGGSVTPGSNRLWMEDFSIVPGETKRVSLMLDNDKVFTAFQVDLVLPEGISIVTKSNGKPNVTINTDRADDHQMVTNIRENGNVSILMMSLESTPIMGNSGEIVSMQFRASDTFSGTHQIELVDAELTEVDGTATHPEDTYCTVTGPSGPSTVLATSISLNQATAELAEGETLQLVASVLPEDATDKTVTWTSSNAAVATVNANGLVTAVTPGTATITATTNDGSNLTATCAVTINPAVILASSVVLNQTTAEMTEGETLQLTATVLPENATDKTVMWSSSNIVVATVDANGLMNAVAPGTATITATTNDGSNLTASCAVTVNAAVILATSITLDQTTAECFVGETLTLTPLVLPENTTDKSVTWSSSDVQIATIDANGLVTAVAPGMATITATTNDGSGLSATCGINIKQLVTSLTLDKESSELTVGETLQLAATVLPENATDKTVTWTSSNIVVATVDANGLVTALAPGTATITATTNDGSGLSATCGINIKQLVTSLTLDKESSELTVGETLQLAATVLPENATDKTVTWSSSNTVVATVDANALVTALAPGTATITATTNDGSDLTASCTLIVSPQTIVATSITLDMNETSLAVGNTLTINAIVLPEDATYKSVTWSSSNDQIATVDANGLVTAIAAGTATISASSVDGSNLSTACVITVIEPTVSSVLEINERAIRLQLSNTCQLVVTTEGAGSVTWASSNATIASVDANGVVTAHKNGIAIITATTSSGAEAWCAVYCYLRGDVDDTNKVDVTDVNTIVNIILGKE